MTSLGTTLGVEEEYLLLDRENGRPAPRAGLVQAAAHMEPVLGRDEVDNELLQSQVEVATPVCTGLDEVTGHLARFRQAATGGAPLSAGDGVPVTQTPRYREMREDAARLVDEQLINGMHIHVAVP